jgi:uncharacterized protein
MPGLPIQQEDRTTIVDVLRGFALFGVLLGNFSGMLTNNTPDEIINSISTSADHVLDYLHTIFIEHKFMTLFSILFGYGFGVIMERLEKKGMNTTSFFLRRMFWLFVFGCINLALWNGDILHVYAIAGLFLLFFKRSSDRFIILSSAFFMLILPFILRCYQHFYLNYHLNYAALQKSYYETIKYGSLKDVAVLNYKAYPSEWIYTTVEWRDLSETLGRFLLGYYVLRQQILTRLTDHYPLIKKIWKICLVIGIAGIPVRWLADNNMLPGKFWFNPLFSIVIIATTLFYGTSIIRLFQKRRLRALMEMFRNLGRMTLTNYLVQTLVYLIIFYHIGFGLLGEWPLRYIWPASFLLYFLQGVFSKWWFTIFLYGPVEWIWRQLTYQRRFRLVK